MVKYFSRIFNPTENDERQDAFLFYKRVFWLSLLTGTLLFLPFLIESKGVFLYFGDYNAQQIPFYEHCVQMVHDGNFGWDWLTDMGSNFVGSYSYYLLGSPYFWFMCLFPAKWAPYLMAPMFIAKFITAAVFSFAYLRRFVKNQHYAVIGALLYSFSGFGIYNIFFNQFHEVIAFFPLLLIAMEELIQNDRKGYFALAVAINAMINYFMFAGQVAFCIIYFLIRCSSKSFRVTLVKFLWLALEAVLGALMSMVLFLPAAFGVMNNPRIGGHYEGWGMLFYKSGGKIATNRYLSIIESFFFPPDIPSRKNFIVDDNARWASLTAWIPLFGMTGVASYIAKRKKTWLAVANITFMLMALIPLGNSTFFLLNSAYYARWYYMMILMMVAATVVALDKKMNFRPGLILTGVVCGAFTVALGLTWKLDEDAETATYTLGQPAFVDRFWVYVAIAAACLIITFVLTKYYRGKPRFNAILSYAVVICILIYGWVHIFYGKCHSWGTDFLLNQAIGGWEQMAPETVDPVMLQVTATQPSNGEIKTDSAEKKEGETAVITVTANEGYELEYIKINDTKLTLSASSYTVTVPSGGLKISASFVTAGTSDAEKYDGDYAVTLNSTSLDLPVLEDNLLYRIDCYDGALDNLGLYWQLPSIRCFHTVVPPSIMNSYPKLADVSRSVGSRAEASKFGLRSFFSVKYYYIETSKEGNFSAKGFRMIGRKNGMTVYENENYIPMGFTYTEFMTESDFEKITSSSRHLYLTQYMIVPDDAADLFETFMTRVSYSARTELSSTSESKMVIYRQNCIDRASGACDSFEYDSYGFKAVTQNMDKANYVFFSVPYEEGWSAKVNGKDVEIEQVFYGYMAVKCDAGVNTIEFSYETPGLKYGAILTAVGVALWLVYMFLTRKSHRKIKTFFTDRYYENDCYEEEIISSTAADAEPQALPDGEEKKE